MPFPLIRRPLQADRMWRARWRASARGEAERRRLSDDDIEQIVRAEIAGRQAAARDYDRAGHAGQADRLRREAQVLMSAIDTG